MQHKLRRIDLGDEERGSIIQRQKKTLERLVKENNDSKNLIDKLVEQGAGRTRFVMSSQKELTELEDILRRVTIRLDSEFKRNQVLKELVGILGSEDKKFKRDELQESSKVASQKQKTLKKQEYDTEQILQKHNEQVAKINVLKEQISGSRRERVVYSNLFKKIEKQIKMYEEDYKNMLLETHEFEKKQKTICDQISLKKRSDKQLYVDYNEDEEDHAPRVSHKSPIKASSIYVQTTFPGLMPKRTLNKTASVLETLSEYNLFFDVLKCHTREESEFDLIHRFPQFGSENQTLSARIQQINDQILEQSQALKQVRSELYHNECCEGKTRQEVETRLPETPHQSTLDSQQSQQIKMGNKYLSECLTSVATILNIPITSLQIEEVFQVIQNKLAKLNSQQRVQSLSSETTLNKRNGEFETHIQCVIEKMDRYQQSEKILSKNNLENECAKELSRHKRVTKLKK